MIDATRLACEDTRRLLRLIEKQFPSGPPKSEPSDYRSPLPTEEKEGSLLRP
jgi:hypothetical protein